MEASTNLILEIIRSEIGKPTGNLTDDDFEKVQELQLPEANYADTRWKSKFEGGGVITEAKALANLTQLKFLNLKDHKISDAGPLANLTQLESLNLRGNEISDVGPLAKLTKIWRLSLCHNKIRDVSGLACLTELQDLDLGGNLISDISPLKHLVSLRSLNLWGNPIINLEPLMQMHDLTFLCIALQKDYEISAWNVLSKLKLTHLYLLGNIDCVLNALSKNTSIKNIGLLPEWVEQAEEQLPNVNFINLERQGFDYECEDGRWDV